MPALDSTWGLVLILLAGVAVVVGGVLVLRLQAFLALILGALVVGSLTPSTAIERDAMTRRGLPIVALEPDGLTVELDLTVKDAPYVEPGMVCPVIRRGRLGSAPVFAHVAIRELVRDAERSDSKPRRALGELVEEPPPPDAPFDWRPAAGATPEVGDLAISPEVRRAAADAGRTSAADRVANGFGATCTSIGILVALASIIGKCLLDSGAADRIVRSALKLTGEKGAPVAFAAGGYLLGIPVFFDTVFYLMIPLGKALRMRTGRNYLLYVLTIVCGATMTHSLVPPTPGPAQAAQQLGVDMGLMILAGSLVGLITATYGVLHALVVNRWWDLPLRETPDVKVEELEAISRRDEAELPPLFWSLVPIVLPVVLIGGLAIAKRSMDSVPGWMQALGNNNIAVLLAVVVSMGLLVRTCRTSRKDLAEAVQNALAGAGVVILVTAGGGAFGAVLQQADVAGLLGKLPSSSPLLMVGGAFLITTAIRTAQGSATVAMITAAGIFSGVAHSGTLPFHPVYLALAIGCGSKPIAWMNDSGFWVITRMSGMTEAEGLKYVTPLSGLMGLIGGLVTMLGAVVFPLK